MDYSYNEKYTRSSGSMNFTVLKNTSMTKNI